MAAEKKQEKHENGYHIRFVSLVWCILRSGSRSKGSPASQRRITAFGVDLRSKHNAGVPNGFAMSCAAGLIYVHDSWCTWCKHNANRLCRWPVVCVRLLVYLRHACCQFSAARHAWQRTCSWPDSALLMFPESLHTSLESAYQEVPNAEWSSASTVKNALVSQLAIEDASRGS